MSALESACNPITTYTICPLRRVGEMQSALKAVQPLTGTSILA